MICRLSRYDPNDTKFGGLDVNEAKRLRHLEEENRRLKHLLADAMLDNAILKDVVSRKT